MQALSIIDIEKHEEEVLEKEDDNLENHIKEYIVLVKKFENLYRLQSFLNDDLQTLKIIKK